MDMASLKSDTPPPGLDSYMTPPPDDDLTPTDANKKFELAAGSSRRPPTNFGEDFEGGDLIIDEREGAEQDVAAADYSPKEDLPVDSSAEGDFSMLHMLADAAAARSHEMLSRDSSPRTSSSSTSSSLGEPSKTASSESPSNDELLSNEAIEFRHSSATIAASRNNNSRKRGLEYSSERFVQLCIIF
jgi:hypothetical protein